MLGKSEGRWWNPLNSLLPLLLPFHHILSEETSARSTPNSTVVSSHTVGLKNIQIVQGNYRFKTVQFLGLLKVSSSRICSSLDVIESNLWNTNLPFKSPTKGQLISKGLFGLIFEPKILRISALASKKRSNKKRHFLPLISGFHFNSLTRLFWFNLILEAKA